MAASKVETNIEKGFNTVKSTTEKLNENAINFADSLVDETVATGKEWQDVMAKVMKTGTTLFGKQQDFVFDTLEAVKAQYFTGTKRFGKLFSFNVAEKNVEKAVVKGTEIVKKEKIVKKEVAKAKAATQKISAKKAVTKKITAKATTKNDDLKVIDGIGPKLATILNEGGITTYQHLVSMKATAVKEILLAAGPRYKMHNPTSWAAQAKLAAAGKTDELKTFQAELKSAKSAK